LKDKKRDECTEHLQKIQTVFDSISFSENIKIHVHTADLKSFFRVWDLEDIKNDSLMFFRDSLQMIKEHKKELAGIEIGRFSMLMRGISPVLDGDEYLGSIEVISNFDKITKDLKKREIDFYVLMDKKYQQISTKVSYSKEDYVGKYIVINSVNSELNVFREVTFKGTGYKATKNHYVIYTPIYDIAGEKIGFYVLKILKSKL
jgi:methyl-accepting chemotaxis protein